MSGDTENQRPSSVEKLMKYAKAPDCELDPPPGYLQTRLEMWDRLYAKYKSELEAKKSESITISLPDGKQIAGESWRTTPYQIASGISQGLADSCIISKVNGVVWDLDRPLEGDATVQLLKFEDDEAKAVFWHSTAHTLGEAMERNLGGCLCYGPPIQDGFYYDMFTQDRFVKEEDFKQLETIMKCIVKEKQPFERLEMKVEDLMEMFKYNEFKLRILKEKVKTPTTTVYRCGPLIDLCMGPHVRHTGKIKAFQVTKSSSAFWEGKADMETLQRVYGISFPDPKQLKEWQKIQAEAAARDHRKLGKEQELFFFHPLSPGSCFFNPKGAHIYHTLTEFIRKQYRKRGFSEVISPNMYNAKLWQKSGHWEHYADNMFKIEIEKEFFGLKPMNCPGHCLMFESRPRTHAELPIRMADFGVLHRNEISGALSGLTRVRRFCQDDAHIFCRKDQVVDEIKAALEFLKFVYADVFGFSFKLYLSTRPEEGYLGTVETWTDAEKQLEDALNEFGQKWELNPGDGAFYGPKIDITIMDALKRQHQCATLQLDFNLPERFNLHYSDAKGDRQRPVMLHRAILGSLERMIAILTENFGGKWPFWLSPRQIMIVPVHEKCHDYCEDLRKHLYDSGFEVETNVDPTESFNRKIRNAQLAQCNYILVVGEKEMTNGTVNVRTRDNKVHGEMSKDELVVRFKRLQDEYVKDSEEASEFHK